MARGIINDIFGERVELPGGGHADVLARAGERRAGPAADGTVTETETLTVSETEVGAEVERRVREVVSPARRHDPLPVEPGQVAADRPEQRQQR